MCYNVVGDTMAKIMIVEDDQTLREEVKSLLDHHGYETMTLTNFIDPVEEILSSNPDLVLLDITLPTLSGEQILKEIRKKSDVFVIMLTSKNTEMDEVLSMSYGADDYISKPYHPTILLLHIESILKRREHHEDTLKYQDVIVNPLKSTLERKGQTLLLSKNELGIFVYLLKQVGTIVTRDDLMNYLWDTNVFIDDNTLTVNMNRLRKKLEEIGLENVIETRRGQGYILL